MSGGNVVTLRLTPLVRVQRWSAGWIVTVRPCPPGADSCRNFDTEAEAADYAARLQLEHGWRVRPVQYAANTLPGAA